MNDQPKSAPDGIRRHVSTFHTLSRKALETFDKLISANAKELTRPLHHLFLRMAYQAETTSQAARLLITYNLTIPALALIRVRLEQLIVCSYLIHEEKREGIEPFVHFIDIQEHLQMRVAVANKAMAEHLTAVDFPLLEAKAIEAQQKLTPEFSPVTDRFQRHWTPLDLHSMTKRRDVLASSKTRIHKIKLETCYVSVYKTLSSIVHSDCSSLSFNYIDLFASNAGQVIMTTCPFWAAFGSNFCAMFDIIQCYEILHFLGIDASEFETIVTEWQAARAEFAANAERYP